MESNAAHVRNCTISQWKQEGFAVRAGRARTKHSFQRILYHQLEPGEGRVNPAGGTAKLLGVEAAVVGSATSQDVNRPLLNRRGLHRNNNPDVLEELQA